MATKIQPRYAIAVSWSGARVWVSHCARDGRFLTTRQRDAARTMLEAAARERLRGIVAAGVPGVVDWLRVVPV